MSKTIFLQRVGVIVPITIFIFKVIKLNNYMELLFTNKGHNNFDLFDSIILLLSLQFMTNFIFFIYQIIQF